MSVSRIAYQTLGEGPPDLVAGSDLVPRPGLHSLKGISEDWQLLAAGV